MNLREINNGYGGHIYFSYFGAGPWYDLATDSEPVKNWGKDTTVNGNTLIDAGSLVDNFAPGTAYIITLKVKSDKDTANDFQLGVNDGASNILATDLQVNTIDPANKIRLVSGTVWLPVTATRAQFKFNCLGVSTCIPQNYTAAPLVTRYRVGSKVIHDDVT